MDSSHLTPDQRHKLLLAVADRRDYFARVRDRMRGHHWPEDDPVYHAVCRAYDAAHGVITALCNREETKPTPPDWMKHMGKDEQSDRTR